MQDELPEIAFAHIPVLGVEVVAGLSIASQGHYLDATVGGGGHSALILKAAEVSVLAIDQDDQALKAAQETLVEFGDRVQFQQSNFANFDPGETKFDGILADLGVSSAQFDMPSRGFSFRHTAPLDMRMDRRQDLTAADVINEWEEVNLANIFYTYGEERLSRRIARRIVEKRPFKRQPIWQKRSLILFHLNIAMGEFIRQLASFRPYELRLIKSLRP